MLPAVSDRASGPPAFGSPRGSLRFSYTCSRVYLSSNALGNFFGKCFVLLTRQRVDQLNRPDNAS